MTLEEKAHEYTIKNVCNNCNQCQSKGYIGCNTFRFAKKTYIDSAKENGIQWHDLREDVYDLPKMIDDERKISQDVWLHIENWGREVGYYDYHRNYWVVRCRQVNLPIIAWCESPTFDKE